MREMAQQELRDVLKEQKTEAFLARLISEKFEGGLLGSSLSVRDSDADCQYLIRKKPITAEQCTQTESPMSRYRKTNDANMEKLRTILGRNRSTDHMASTPKVSQSIFTSNPLELKKLSSKTPKHSLDISSCFQTQPQGVKHQGFFQNKPNQLRKLKIRKGSLTKTAVSEDVSMIEAASDGCNQGVHGVDKKKTPTLINNNSKNGGQPISYKKMNLSQFAVQFNQNMRNRASPDFENSKMDKPLLPAESMSHMYYSIPHSDTSNGDIKKGAKTHRGQSKKCQSVR